jgi:hypothetical protein
MLVEHSNLGQDFPDANAGMRKFLKKSHSPPFEVPSFPGSAWERTGARLCLAYNEDGRQSLQGSAFPGRAWERGYFSLGTEAR